MGKRWSSRVGGSALVVGLLMVVTVGCGDGDGGDDVALGAAPGDPVAVAGTTDQGFRVQLEPVDGRRIRVDVSAECEAEGADYAEGTWSVQLDDHELVAAVAQDGRFEIDEDYVVEGTDGDETHVELRIEGAFTSDGTAVGTLDAHERSYNGQLGDFDAECSTGTIEWQADEPLGDAAATQVEVPVEGVSMLLPAGPDLLAVAAAAYQDPPADRPPLAAVAIDGATGEAGAPLTLPPSTDESVSTLEHSHTLAVTGSSVWTADYGPYGNGDPTTLVRTDLTSGEQSASVEAEQIMAMVAGHDALWTLIEGGPDYDLTLEKRDSVSGEVVATVPSALGVLAVGPSELWHIEEIDAEGEGGTVSRIDPETLETVDSFPADVEWLDPAGVVATDDLLWMPSREADRVSLLDPASGEVTVVEPPSAPGSLAADEEGAWITNPEEDVIRRIEGGEIVRTVDVPEGMTQIATTEDGQLWLAGDNRVVQLDRATLGG